MASNTVIKQEQTFPLRLLVDKERNRVVVAEASGDFIDILFSFLTLPLGTIIRLVSNKQQQHGQPAEIGCINNLYRSVESAEFFWNLICKQMLLRPQNPCEDRCQKLKLKLDDTEPLKYFMCSRHCREGWDRLLLLSTFEGASCCSCGKLMNKKMKLLGDSSEETHEDGVFVKEEDKYLVFDDLKVLQNSTSNFMKELVQLGYRNFNKLTEMSPDVGLEEILDLLKLALTSKSPLSDVFLANGGSRGMCTSSPKIREPGRRYSSSTISLKVIVRKSKKKILYAEAGEGFVDFLFSFLTAPLGSIIKLLDGNSSLGCMDILYKSVKDFNLSWFITRHCFNNPLLDPGVAPQFGSSLQLVSLCELGTPTYWYGTGVVKNNICYVDGNGVISKKSSLVKDPQKMILFDPRSRDGKSNVGFVRRPSIFIVWDDLQVTPLTNTSSISFMQNLNVPLDDLEEHVLKIETVEALNLLEASLTSKAALTDGLSNLLKKPNEDAKA